MRTDLFGQESTVEIIPPASDDSALLCAWDAYRASWKMADRHGRAAGDLPDGSRRAVTRALEKAAVGVIKAPPPATLEGLRAKLIMAAVSGADSEMMLRRYVLGERLPEITPLNDFVGALLLDAISAVERMIQDEPEPAREVH